LLVLANDERLVEQIRSGNEVAFEVAFQRHGPAILSFCRHMLRSREEAEDVVQHTFAAAYSGLLAGDRAIALKPWLFAIARNRCLSLLRRPRPELADPSELPTAGLAEAVEQRAELRELLSDVAQLPPGQRAALLLAEIGDLSQAEVAEVLECEVSHVKGLVHRGRRSLIERRDARATPCQEIREQLANLRGGALRRSTLRHHLRDCPGCTAFRAQVKQQRSMLAAALPVVPSAGLKSNVLAAVGIGGGQAAGGAGLAALGGASAAAPGSATLAKIAIVGVLAGGGAVAGEDLRRDGAAPPSRGAEAAKPGLPPNRATSVTPEGTSTPRSGAPTRLRVHPGTGPPPVGSPRPERAHGRPSSPAHGRTPATPARPEATGRRAQGPERRSGRATTNAHPRSHRPTSRPPAARGRAERPRPVDRAPNGGRPAAAPKERAEK
jgi:RNA polymerase sigma factor (sigma-70 family)